jgi:hypothetical protein
MAEPTSDEEHPAKHAVEDVAEDLHEVWVEADRLRRLVEDKLSRWSERKVEHARGWAERLTSLRDKLERTLADVDARTDEVAGRFPRRPSE